MKKDQTRAIGLKLNEKDINTVTDALLSNIQLELETIGKYLKVLCEVQIKINKDTK